MSLTRPEKVSRERADMTIAYPMWLAWSKEDHAYHVRCRDLPEVLTAGSTKAEALEMAADALEVALAGRIEDEEDIPGPSKPRKREYLIALPAQLAAKLAVYRAWRAAGIQQSGACQEARYRRRGGTSHPQSALWHQIRSARGGARRPWSSTPYRFKANETRCGLMNVLS